MDPLESCDIQSRRNIVYSYLSGCDHLEDDGWANSRINYVFERLKRGTELFESLIILIIGEPSCGKTYIVRSSIKRVLHTNSNIEIIELYTYYYKDDIKCMQVLLSRLETLTGSLTTKGINHVVSEIQSRMLHCLKYLKAKDGLERFTKGAYDCTTTAGSCSKRQGLLYFLGDSIQLKDTAFSLVCITSDLKATERLEKRVKSRFVHESVCCYNDFNILEYLDNIPISSNLKASYRDYICGKNGSYFVTLTNIASCLSTVAHYDTSNKGDKYKNDNKSDYNFNGNIIPEVMESDCDDFSGALSLSKHKSIHYRDPTDATNEICNLDEINNKSFRIPLDNSVMESCFHQSKMSEHVANSFNHLNIPEHYILISLTRLHCKGVYPQTFTMIENDVDDMIQFYPQEKHTIPKSQALKRAFFNLISLGFIEWVNYAQNNINGVNIRISANDILGTTIPCRFPLYQRYLKIQFTNLLPIHMSQWLSLSNRTLD